MSAEHDVEGWFVAGEMVVAMASVAGNLLVMFTIYYNPRLQTGSNYYVLSLASSDLMVGLFCCPVVLVTYSGHPRNYHLCVFLTATMLFIRFIPMFTLVVAAIDRYFAVTDNDWHSRSMSKRKIRRLLLFAWTVAFLIGNLPSMGWNLGRVSEFR